RRRSGGASFRIGEVGSLPERVAHAIAISIMFAHLTCLLTRRIASRTRAPGQLQFSERAQEREKCRARERIVPGVSRARDGALATVREDRLLQRGRAPVVQVRAAR